MKQFRVIERDVKIEQLEELFRHHGAKDFGVFLNYPYSIRVSSKESFAFHENNKICNQIIREFRARTNTTSIFAAYW